MTYSPPDTTPRRLRIESDREPGSIFKGIMYAVPFLLVGLFMREYVPSASVWGAWLFIVLGVGWILNWLRTTYGRYKYGGAWLEVDMPARLGQRLSARLIIRNRVSARHFSANLSCRHVHWQDTFDEIKRDFTDSLRSLKEDVLWHEEAQFPILSGNARSEGQIELTLPADLPATDPRLSDGKQLQPGHYWELKIDITEPGVHFQRSFRVPVTQQ